MAGITTYSFKTVLRSTVYHRRPQPIRYIAKEKRPQHTRGLLEIALRTLKLIRRNQELQQKLVQLQQETQTFIVSVMANPENQTVRKDSE